MKDVLIVGGGPAGSALAVQLGRRGLTVELLERDRFPRDKPCGEGILPGGVEVLKFMGLEEPLSGHKLMGVQYHVGKRQIRAGFGLGSDGSERFGLGQRRQFLDNLLWDTAKATEGVTVHQGVAATRALVEGGRAVGVLTKGVERRARWVVGADGASSALRRSLRLERIDEPRRVGVRVHFCNLSSEAKIHDIHVFLRPGYEIYVTPLPNRQLLVAALTCQGNARKLRDNFWFWCANEPLLCCWLRGAEQSSPLMGRTSLRRHLAASPLPKGLTFIGDASASSDPITAGGISLALRDAELLAEALPEMIRGSRLAESRFARSQDSARRTHRLLGEGLLTLSAKPAVAEQACRLLDSFPWAMNALVAMAAQ